MDTIRETNNAIFDDIFWVHLAYSTAADGIDCLRALLGAERHYAPSSPALRLSIKDAVSWKTRRLPRRLDGWPKI